MSILIGISLNLSCESNKKRIETVVLILEVDITWTKLSIVLQNAKTLDAKSAP